MDGFEFTLEILAFNPGKPELRSIHHLDILVFEAEAQGINFEGLPYTLYLPVDTPVGSEVFTVQVSAVGTNVDDIRFDLPG